jgi:hypothetical protein
MVEKPFLVKQVSQNHLCKIELNKVGDVKKEEKLSYLNGGTRCFLVFYVFLVSVFNLILPCVLITGMALLSFYMPSDSGEKVSLATA